MQFGSTQSDGFVRSKPDLTLLPMFREALTDTDLEEYKHMPEGDEYRWITSIRRIDWDKYFAKQKNIHELVNLASRSIPNNPIGFLRPDWVNSANQIYTDKCPSWAKDYANNFKNAVKENNFNAMLEWYEIIKELT